MNALRLLDHCTRMTYVNTHLCDYGRQCALVGALVLKRRGGYVIECEADINGNRLPVEIATDGQIRRLDDGFIGQWFRLVIHGHRQTLTAEFVVNFQSVHRIYRGMAEIAHTANELFLPRDVIALVCQFEEEGRFEAESAKFSDPMFVGRFFEAYHEEPSLDDGYALEEELVMGFALLDLILTLRAIEENPSRMYRELGPERYHLALTLRDRMGL